MSLTVPADVVDSLPEKLWSLGNVFKLFDRDLHFCTRETRTIERLRASTRSRARRPIRASTSDGADEQIVV